MILSSSKSPTGRSKCDEIDRVLQALKQEYFFFFLQFLAPDFFLAGTFFCFLGSATLALAFFHFCGALFSISLYLFKLIIQNIKYNLWLLNPYKQ